MIEVQRLRQVARLDAGSEHAPEQPRERAEQRQEEDRQREIERGVKISNPARKACFMSGEEGANPTKQRQSDQRSREADQKVSDGEPAADGISASRPLDDWVDGGAYIRADHESKRRGERNDPLRG